MTQNSHRSLLSRLMFALGIGLTVLLSISGYSLFRYVTFELTEEFDSGLAEQARALTMMVEQTTHADVDFELVEPEHEDFAAKVKPDYFQIWNNSTTIFKSESLLKSDFPMVIGTLEQPGFESIELSDDARVRLVGIQFVPRLEVEDEDGDVDELAATPLDKSERALITLVVAKPTAELDHTLAVFGRSIFAIFAITILMALGMLYGLVRHGLKPLSTLANRIKQVDEVRLSKPIEIESAPAELVPVVGRLNELLSRLDFAFQREKNFSADVAHEMRTPLAGLRSSMQVALSQERDAESYRETIDECLSISNQLSAMIENLLSLARLENSTEPHDYQQFNADELIEQCWELVASKSEIRSIKPDFQFSHPLQVNSDLEKLRQVVLNVLDNAVSYADEGSVVSIVGNRSDTNLTIRVSNVARDFCAEDATHVFERFWRGDQSRTDTQNHSGLGLSVCQSIVQHLGGQISVEIGPSEHFIAKVVVPIRAAHRNRVDTEARMAKQS